MSNLKLTIHDEEFQRFIKRFPRTLTKDIRSAINKELEKTIKLAQTYAPFEDGYLREGIIKGRIFEKQNEVSGTVVWTETKPIRRTSFKKTKWDNFLNWMENSSFAKEVYWKYGYPDFMARAIQKEKKGISKLFEKTIRNSIKRS